MSAADVPTPPQRRWSTIPTHPVGPGLVRRIRRRAGRRDLDRRPASRTAAVLELREERAGPTRETSVSVGVVVRANVVVGTIDDTRPGVTGSRPHVAFAFVAGGHGAAACRGGPARARHPRTPRALRPTA